MDIQATYSQMAEWYQDYPESRGNILTVLYSGVNKASIQLYSEFIAGNAFDIWDDVSKNHARVIDSINKYLANPVTLGATIFRKYKIFDDQHNFNKAVSIFYLYNRVIEEWQGEWEDELDSILLGDTKVTMPEEFKHTFAIEEIAPEIEVDMVKFYEFYKLYPMKRTDLYKYIITFLMEYTAALNKARREASTSILDATTDVYTRRVEELEGKVKSAQKQRNEMSKKYNEMLAEVQSVDSLRKELDKKDAEFYRLLMQNAALQDKLDLIEFESGTIEEEINKKEEEIEELTQDISLDDYKVILITDRTYASKYSMESIDLNSKVDRASKIDYADIVVFDTKHNSHRAYWVAKERCKTKGKHFMHFNGSTNNLEKEVKKFILMHVI